MSLPLTDGNEDLRGAVSAEVFTHPLTEPRPQEAISGTFSATSSAGLRRPEPRP
jgi:hypothetical protein